MRDLDCFENYVEIAPTGNAEIPQPLDVLEVKLHCGYHAQDPNDLILQGIARVVAQFCERYTRRTLIQKSFQYYDDTLRDSEIRILKCPVIEGSLQISTFNGTVYAPVDSTLYEVTYTPATYSKITLKPGCSWPAIIDHPKAVRYEFTAGYGAAAAAIPEVLRYAMLEHCLFLDRNRGDFSGKSSDLPSSVKQIYSSYALFNHF